MTAFADTNWLIAAYFPLEQPHRSAVVQRFVGKYDFPWMISHPVLLECENSFRAVGGSSTPPEYREFISDIGSRILMRGDSWESIASKAVALFQRYSPSAVVGSLDMLILASALQAGATHFLSFDTNSNLRALAAVLRLKVFPELTVDDRRRMAQFR